MAIQHKLIHITDETDLQSVLQQAAREPVVLEKGGLRYILSRTETEDTDTRRDSTHAPEAVRRALERSAGAFAGMDTARFKRELRDQREQDTSGRPA